MAAVAVVCLRGDDAYLESCLKHLIAHGVDFAILDNGISRDARALLARPPYRDALREVRPLPFAGAFELERQIEAKQQLFDSLDADWVIHLDVDEAMHAYAAGERLIDSLARIDAAGFNVVNFDEFVFLPVDRAFEPGAWPQPMTAYYLFDPGGPRLMRAWRKDSGLGLMPGGAGHFLSGGAVRAAPEHFVLRHYMFLDQEHARRKYTRRVFSEAELQQGWHGNRVGYGEQAFDFPPLSVLKQLPDPGSRAFDRSDPWRRHYWEGAAEG